VVTVTRALAWTTLRTLAVVDALVRRFAAHNAILTLVAPRASDGNETDTVPKRSTADTNAMRADLDRDGWPERRAAGSKTGEFIGRSPV
jgi:hypothetical protein